MSSIIQAETKKWGNSIGIIIPKDILEKEGIKENQKVEILLLPDSKKAFNSLFGLAKGKIKKNSQEIKDELRKELYN